MASDVLGARPRPTSERIETRWPSLHHRGGLHSGARPRLTSEGIETPTLPNPRNAEVEGSIPFRSTLK